MMRTCCLSCRKRRTPPLTPLTARRPRYQVRQGFFVRLFARSSTVCSLPFRRSHLGIHIEGRTTCTVFLPSEVRSRQ